MKEKCDRTLASQIEKSQSLVSNALLSLLRPPNHPYYAPKATMAPKKTAAPKEAPVSLGPNVAEGENVFGVAHIFAS